jgi:hypothetical protein
MRDVPRRLMSAVLLLCFGVSLSCAPASRPLDLRQNTGDPEGVLPSTTPFDDDPAMRAVYQNYYWFGYAEAMRGVGSTFCGNGHPWYDAQRRGFYDGQMEGFRKRYAKAGVAISN